MTTTAKRRSPGEGTVDSYSTKRGLRWYWKTTLTVPDGSRKTVWKRGFTTKAKAQTALRAAIVAADKREYAEPSKQPTGPYLTEWVNGQSELRPSTMASYRKNIRLHLEPRLRDIPLASLTSTRINALYRELETSGRADHRAGEGLSARTVRYVAMILNSALADAVDTGRLVRNPAAKATPPSAERAKSPEMTPWTEHELKHIFLPWSAENSPHHVAWRVLAYTGARRGELLELRWRDWDAKESTFKIRRSAGVIRNKGEGAAVEVGLTKTGRDRTIAIDPGTAALLKSWRSARAELGLHLVRPDSLIFSDLEGAHLHPERFSRTFQETVARCKKALPEYTASALCAVKDDKDQECGEELAALPVIRLHDLRHTHATILLRKGVPVKAVSVRLGHSTAVVTMTVYAGWMPADDASAAAVFASREVS